MRPRLILAAIAHTDFNPRIPYGMRRQLGCCRCSVVYFNPRIPYGMRRTNVERLQRSPNFNPRIPYGMRLAQAFSYVIEA